MFMYSSGSAVTPVMKVTSPVAIIILCIYVSYHHLHFDKLQRQPPSKYQNEPIICPTLKRAGVILFRRC